jgi:hypothetical protein
VYPGVTFDSRRISRINEESTPGFDEFHAASPRYLPASWEIEMSKRMSWSNALLLTPLAVLVIAGSLHRPASAHTERCPEECGIKLEHGPWAYSGDRVIVAVCIKAGTKTFPFYGDGTDGCYTVKGLGSSNVTISGGGTSSSCKDISHVYFYYECGVGPISQ